MKRKILFGVALLALVGVSVWNLQFVIKTDSKPYLLLADVEVLAQDETGDWWTCRVTTNC